MTAAHHRLLSGVRRIGLAVKDAVSAMRSRRISRQSRCTVTLEAPDLPRITNPTMIREAPGWVIAARVPWYEMLPDGSYRVSRLAADGSATVMMRLTDGLDITDWTMVTEPDPRAYPDLPPHGLEDPRLFRSGDQLRISWVGLDAPSTFRAAQHARENSGSVFFPDWADARTAVIVADLDGSKAGVPTILPSPLGNAREKNWMPLPNDTGQLRFIYRLDPFEVATVDDSSDHSFADVRLDRAPGRSRKLERWSGSSPAVRFRGGYLCVAHRALREFALIPLVGRSVYLHRFVWVSEDLRERRVSRTFRFDSWGIEFCSGLAVEAGRVLMSYGMGDRTAHVTEVAEDTVLALFPRHARPTSEHSTT
ncbi:hypothetical protein [Microbacterium aurantiacum]|uniref:hypothetical protein n=1 Tax=Microbacterium aurantiacum TaxID=162393 RepID=UPI003D7576DA